MSTQGSVSGWIWDTDGVNWDDLEEESLLRNLEQGRGGVEIRLQPRAKRGGMVNMCDRTHTGLPQGLWGRGVLTG